MNHQKIIIKRTVSPDRKIIAEAKSIVQTSGDGKDEMNQSVTVNITSSSSSSSTSSSSSSISI